MYSAIFDDIIEKVIESEGGYSNDRDDAGGETKYGISKRAFPHVDIENLTINEAKELYHEHYWKASKAFLIPDRLLYIYFDMVVNFGQRGAGRVLQQAINGKYPDSVEVDGRVGPKTLAAIKDLEPQRLVAYRVLKFARIVIKKPSQEKFWYGWFRRAVNE